MNCYSSTSSSVHGISQARRLEWVVMIRWILKIWKGLTSIDVISSVHLFSYVWLFVTPWTAAHQASLSLTISQSLPKLKSIELVMPFNHLILCHPLLLSSNFPSISLFSNELGFSSESALCIRWLKDWSFSFGISPSKSIQGWFPLRMTSLIFLLSKGLSRIFSSTTVQKHQFLGTLPSLLSSSHIHTWLMSMYGKTTTILKVISFRFKYINVKK